MARSLAHKPVLLVGLIGIAAIFIMGILVTIYLGGKNNDQLRPIRLGHDTCAHCGMIISDRRFSAAIQTHKDDGSSQFLAFDDIGCFIKHINAGAQKDWYGVVHDFETGDSIKIRQAKFEQGSYHTPMGSGWVAYKDDAPGRLAFENIR